MSRTQHAADQGIKGRTIARRMGREWAEHHHAMPGQPEPVRYGNVDYDQACAHRWRKLTGNWPSWYGT